MQKQRSGFTLVELAATLLATGVAACLAVLIQENTQEEVTPQMRDAAQVREIHKGMIMWAQQNDDWFPLGSKIGRDGSTVAFPEGEPTTLDGSGTIYSIMVFNYLVMPETLISPAESNPAIRACDSFEHDAPSAAVNSEHARWDPGFRGTPLDKLPEGGDAAPGEGVGNVSYAHLSLAGLGRRREWKYTMSENEAVLGNRGPEETAGAWDPQTRRISVTTLSGGATGTQSLTLLFYDPPTSWAGNVCYNDHHVDFATTTHPDDVTYPMIAAGAVERFGDGLFLDEGDASVLDQTAVEDTRDANCLLGLFRRGPSAREYRDHEHVVQYNRDARWFDGMTQ
jgi:hypothetical protein